MAQIIAIPIENATHHTIFTEASKTYRLRFYGLANCQTSQGGLVDAVWWKKDGGATWVYNASQQTHGANHARLVWNKTGGAPPQLPLNELTHEYIYTGMQGGIDGADANWEFWFDDGLYSNNSGTLFVEIEYDEPENEGSLACRDGGYASADLTESNNPISLRLGEKRLQVTDLVLHTPAGELAFTRNYNQNRQTDPRAQFMGLGWIHNHAVALTFYGQAPNRTARVYASTGGVLVLHENGSNHFVASPGSNSVLDYDSGLGDYVLTAPEGTRYRFNSTTGQLKFIDFPNHEQWAYSYTSGRLVEVNDGYNRKLQFAYINNPSGFDDGQLWRVGDHTVTGLTGSMPSGRYVEFTYTPEKQNGVTISSPRALLEQVRDVRGNLWTYDYYGQDSGETNATLFNLMLERRLPSLSTSLEKLTYQFDASVEKVVNGGMELDSDWTAIPGAEPSTNQRSTGQVYSGTYSRHVVANAGQGIESAPWNLTAGRRYTLTARVYAVSGTVKMRVTNTDAFDRTTSGTGSWELLTAVYVPGSSKLSQRLQFLAEGGAATFYVDNVSIQETRLANITQQRGIVSAQPALLETLFEFNYGGTPVTRETRAGNSWLHHFNRGIYGGIQNPIGDETDTSIGDQFRPTLQLVGHVA